MTCKLLQVDIKWWAMVYDIKNRELCTSLQSVIAVRFNSETVHLAKQKWGSPRTTPLSLCTVRLVGLFAVMPLE